jgi:predicted alpha/beta superfamily hydrolase
MIYSKNIKYFFKLWSFVEWVIFVIFALPMSTSRIFHSFHLDISACDSNRICYIILPEKLKESEKEWLDRMAETHSANMVVISGLDWDNDLTPWKAPGLKTGEFGGKAQSFLHTLTADIMVNVESSLRINRVQRFFCGVSLSGLFGIWASCKKDIFEGVASVSGSLWYDGFAEWISENRPYPEKFYLSIGEKEKEAKNPRLASIDAVTKHLYGLLNTAGKDVCLEYNEGNHFGPLIERIEKAITNLLTDYGTDRV